jgi:hypothetical protein
MVEGNTDKDRFMIENFKHTLSARKVNGRNIHIRVIRRNSTDGLRADATNEDKESEVQRLIGAADYIIGYGDKDEGTSSMMRLLLTERYKVSKEKLHAIAEDTSGSFDFNDGEDVIPIFQMILERFAN